MTKKRFLSLVFLVLGTVTLSGCGFKSSAPEGYKVKLEIWGVVDDSDAYNELLGQYKKMNPYVGDIIYRKMSPETYQEDLLDALASGNGPDVFMIRNAWRSTFEDKIVPMPDSALAEKFYRESFVDVVSDDFISQGQIYAAPLSVDSLGLYYNKDLFNAVGIVSPPTTWEEMIDMLKKLNRVDTFGNIVQSGIALGTGDNINRSSDVLLALMLQKNVDIGGTQNGRVNFSSEGGRSALAFYNQFSDIRSSNYSWNPRLHYSVDAFYEGTLGMMLNYSWRYDELKKKNSKFNFGVAPLPQFAGEKPVNFANYWGFVVAKNKTILADQSVTIDASKQNMLRVHEAWQFIRYMTFPHTNNMMTLTNGLANTSKDFTLTFDPAKKYLERTRKPAARRDLINAQKTDSTLAPFALGNLIAKNGYQGSPETVTSALVEAINTVNRGEKRIDEALSVATNRINVSGGR